VVFHAEAHKNREGINDLARALSGMPDTSGRLQAAYGKWPGLYARLALTFHLIEVADTIAQTGQRPQTQILSEATARRAAAYIEDILLPHLLRADEVMYATPQTGHARWIAEFILAQGKDRVTIRDVVRAYKPLKPSEKRRELAEVMDGLVTMAWLLPENPDALAVAQTGWAVNPKVLERFAERGLAERERRAKVREEMQALIRNRTGRKG
jgi:hypothetical protein